MHVWTRDKQRYCCYKQMIGCHTKVRWSPLKLKSILSYWTIVCKHFGLWIFRHNIFGLFLFISPYKMEHCCHELRWPIGPTITPSRTSNTSPCRSKCPFLHHLPKLSTTLWTSRSTMLVMVVAIWEPWNVRGMSGNMTQDNSFCFAQDPPQVIKVPVPGQPHVVSGRMSKKTVATCVLFSEGFVDLRTTICCFCQVVLDISCDTFCDKLQQIPRFFVHPQTKQPPKKNMLAAEVPKYIHQKHYVPVPEPSPPTYHKVPVPVPVKEPGKAKEFNFCGWLYNISYISDIFWLASSYDVFSFRMILADLFQLGRTRQNHRVSPGDQGAGASATSHHCQEQGMASENRKGPREGLLKQLEALALPTVCLGTASP